MTLQPTSEAHPRRRRTATLLVAAVVVGITLATLLIMEMSRPVPGRTQYYTSPPVSAELSEEARAGCLELSMAQKQIDGDPEACLREYWTIDRLRAAERTRFDWYADSGRRLTPCDDDYVRPRWTFNEKCHLPDMEDPAFHQWDLPPDGAVWWLDQPTRDPGRTTAD